MVESLIEAFSNNTFPYMNYNNNMPKYCSVMLEHNGVIYCKDGTQYVRTPAGPWRVKNNKRDRQAYRKGKAKSPYGKA